MARVKVGHLAHARPVEVASQAVLPQAQRGGAAVVASVSVEVVVAGVAAADAVPRRRLVPLVAAHHLRSHVVPISDVRPPHTEEAAGVVRQVPVLILGPVRPVRLLVQLPQRCRLRCAHPAEHAAWQQAQHRSPQRFALCRRYLLLGIFCSQKSLQHERSACEWEPLCWRSSSVERSLVGWSTAGLDLVSPREP